MPEVIFWDVDTQKDFIMKDGKLAVPEAEEIIVNLERLTRHAREQGIPIVGSVDDHTESDPEISLKPDYRETFPPHCLKGTEGQEKIPETRPLHPLWIEPDPYPAEELRRLVREHKGEIIFKKHWFDVFTNPNVKAALEVLNPSQIVVYGVCTDVCDAYAINGFLREGKYQVWLVKDAAKPISKEREKALLEEWEKKGVRIVTTQEVLEKVDLHQKSQA